MRSPRLAALELKRFGRGRLPRAAMAAMLLLPLLYGALYLWSFWDPYDRLDRIPVALVNEDSGASTKDADGKREKIAAGDDIVAGLRDSDTFDWRETSPQEAAKGVADGTYYLSLTIPSDFSHKVASSSGDSPESGALRVHTNDSNNYIVGQISRTVFSEVRASASAKTSAGFYDRIFVSFSSLHDATSEAADGSRKLDKGIGKAKNGAGELAEGAAQAKRGSKDLRNGVTELQKGSAELSRGTKQVASGTQQLATKVNKLAKAVEPLTEQDDTGDDIAAIAGRVASGAQKAQKHVATLPKDTARAAKLARGAANGASSLHTKLCEQDAVQSQDSDQKLNAVDCAELKKHVDYTRQAAEAAESLNERVQEYDDFDELHKDLGKLRKAAKDIEKRAPDLGEDLATAVKQVNALNNGAQKVNTGAGKLHTGLTSAQSGAGELDAGLADLSSGARSLDGGLFKLGDGSKKLSEGLRDGTGRIPNYDEDERADRSSVMSDPVRLLTDNSNAAPNYGTGFAPYFIPLSLWVGAMVCYMLLPPLNRRALAAGAPAWRTALAGWLPVAAIGWAQVLTLMAVLHWGLGLRMERAAGTIGFLLLVTVCFAAIIQWFNAKFGPAGRIIVLAALMLQLTSAGGTYPVQSSPDFFNFLHPLLPMSYVVEGLRHLITGGGMGPVWQACAVLLAFTVGALALTALTARRSAVWTMKRLHPELTL